MANLDISKNKYLKKSAILDMIAKQSKMPYELKRNVNKFLKNN